jgi:hypothetical protein
MMFFLAACTAPEKTPAAPDPAPEIIVTPDALDFGAQAAGTFVTETLTVSNVGDDVLAIRGAVLEDATAPYTVVAEGGLVLAPGATTRFLVTFSPVSVGDASGRLLVGSTDPDAPEVAVPLSGAGIAAGLSVTPGGYDFGATYVGCEAAQTVSLQNAGPAVVTVSDLAFDATSPGLALVADAAPWVLAPGDTRDVVVTYAPLVEGDSAGTLTVTSDDADAPVQAYTFIGTAELYGSNLDSFVAPPVDRVDVVVSLDGSTSMEDELEHAADDLLALADALGAGGFDYQLAVVVAATGCVAGETPFIDGSMSREAQAAALATMVGAAPGTEAEQGLDRMYVATSAAYLGGCNAGMLRVDARLALLRVTDDADTTYGDWSGYADAFDALSIRGLIVHAIAGDYPSGCGDASAANGWYELTVATGGLYLSICEADRASQMEAIASSQATFVGAFDLTARPVPETIVVTVDGVPATTGWSYVASGLRVVFDVPPEEGAVVTVEYALSGDCEE